ncbi:hypothetical protein Acife_1991 [Acidithiobacillus ferrivorans SS3]|uniref:Helix-turn-helix domain-containing protein n=1 Tax=Acidithiobacillus ferrivorans SS3 TaxID=743299 RepID=G0JM61_9PROT|nr:hypothetical protein [Acidithiobacillus ferrivorans]AEM48111.1 hypothetical protein Acife_1991 [Acidithiobacillus ferrivorans SS3]
MNIESELITLEELAVLLHRNVNTLRVAVSNRPESLPPRVRFPGVQRNYWRRSTVEKWIASFEEPLDPTERCDQPTSEMVQRVEFIQQTNSCESKTPHKNKKKNRVGRPTKAEQMRRREVA